MKTGLWVTKDEEVMEICQMSDEHLLNAHRICKEFVLNIHEGVRSALSALMMLQGEMAQYLCESDVNRMDEELGYWEEKEEELLEEIENRELIPKKPRKERLYENL